MRNRVLSQGGNLHHSPSRRWGKGWTWALGLALLVALGCGEGAPPAPCRFSVALGETSPLVAGETASLTLSIHSPALLPSPCFAVVLLPHPWFGAGGGTPQVDRPDEPGHARAILHRSSSSSPREVRVGRGREGVDPAPLEVDLGALGFREGDRLELVLNDLSVQRFTQERLLPVVLARTGQGGPFQEMPVLGVWRVRAGPPAGLRILIPSQTQPSAPMNLTVGLEDRFRNAISGITFTGTAALAEASGASPWTFTATTGARGEPQSVSTTAPVQKGFAWMTVEARVGDRTLTGRSNPTEVGGTGPRIWFGDLHGHTQASDGSGSAEGAFHHAREVAKVDFAALTEHAWQVTSKSWQEGRRASQEAQRPGTFATLDAFEYDVSGHRCVYFPNDPGDLDINDRAAHSWWEVSLARLAPDPPPREPGPYAVDPSRLYRWLKGREALVVPHTSASPWMGDGGDRVEIHTMGVVEVYSAHGQSMDSLAPEAVPGAVPEGTVTEAVLRGLPLRFIAAGDGHDGHLGRTVWGGHPGGLAAVPLETLGREALYGGLRGEGVYATTGHRPLLWFKATHQNSKGISHISLRYAGENPVVSAQVMVGGSVVTEIPGDQTHPLTLVGDFDLPVPTHAPSVWLRVTEEGGGIVWASPQAVPRPGFLEVVGLGGTVGEEEAGVDLSARVPTGHPGVRLWRRVGEDGGGSEVGREAVATTTVPASGLHHRVPYAISGEAEAWWVEDLAEDRGGRRLYGPLWSIPKEPSVALPPYPPWSLPLVPPEGGVIRGTGVGDRRRELARWTRSAIPSPESSSPLLWNPPPETLSELKWWLPDGRSVYILLHQALPPAGYSPLRVWVGRDEAAPTSPPP